MVANLVEKSIEHPLLGFFGPAKVNVLKLNIALEELNKKYFYQIKKHYEVFVEIKNNITFASCFHSIRFKVSKKIVVAICCPFLFYIVAFFVKLAKYTVKINKESIFYKALNTSVWIIKIIVPASFIVTLLQYYGVVDIIAGVFTPLFKYLGLDGQASIVYFSSVLLPLYAPISIIGTLALDLRQTTILALMCLISHNLIVECSVQKLIGMPAYISAPLRICTAIVGGFLLNCILPDNLSEIKTSVAVVTSEELSLLPTLGNWAIATLKLCFKIWIIITALMLLQYYLKKWGVIDKLQKMLGGFMKFCGLSPEVSYIWLVAQTVGLAYGAGIMKQILEEEGDNAPDYRGLNCHVAVNHSLIEDTAIFMMMGVSWYYLIIPRFIFALVIVWIAKLFDKN